MSWNSKTNILILVLLGLSLLLLIMNAKMPEIPIFANKRSPVLKIYRRTLNNWKFDPTLCPKISNIPITELRTPAGNTPFYIYNDADDDVISAQVRVTGSFQPEVSRVIYKLLSSEPDAQFLDLGGNVGVVTLSIAKCGFPVIVVEPMYMNTIRLCNSVKVGNLTEHVTILNTALSDERKYVKLAVTGKNKGGTFVVENWKNNTLLFNDTVMTATLDDILTLPGFRNRKTIIKMDIQGYEGKALEMGKKFFDVVDVRGVLVEWVLFKRTETGKKIIKFFRERNFTPLNYANAQVLSENTSDTWPYDVLWRPNANKFPPSTFLQKLKL